MQDFSDWMKNRITKYGFIENQDFEVFHNFMKNSSGASTHKEYALTLDMAKELAMLEGNEKGKHALRFFIECEKKLREVAATPAALFRKDLAMMIVQAAAAAAEEEAEEEEEEEEEEEKERVPALITEANSEIQANRPKIIFADAVSASETTILVNELAKILKQNGVNIGQNRLFKWMRRNGYVIRRGATDHIICRLRDLWIWGCLKSRKPRL